LPACVQLSLGMDMVTESMPWLITHMVVTALSTEAPRA